MDKLINELKEELKKEIIKELKEDLIGARDLKGLWRGSKRRISYKDNRELDAIIFCDLDEARRVLEGCQRVFDIYGILFMADVKSIAGLKHEPDDKLYGWERSPSICFELTLTTEGYWKLETPIAMRIIEE